MQDSPGTDLMFCFPGSIQNCPRIYRCGMHIHVY